MAAGATSMHYYVQTRQLFVGLENGTINVCIVSFSSENYYFLYFRMNMLGITFRNSYWNKIIIK